MLLIQILQQHITVSVLALISTHIVAPAAHCASEASWDIGFFAYLRNRDEVSAYGEDDATGAGESICQLLAQAALIESHGESRGGE